jgi:hypothetical protein
MNPLGNVSFAAAFGMMISLAPALAGAYFAIRPSERLLSYMRPLSLAGVFAALCTISLGLTNGAIGLSRHPQFNSEMLLGGLSEVFAVAAISFAFLAVAWVCVAIGMRRLGQM